MAYRWRDNSIRIVAVLIALLLWIYVTNEQNPVTDQTYNITLEKEDEPQGYIIKGVPNTVSIRVKGTRSVISTIEKDDFTARVSFAGIESGQKEVPVQVSSPPGVEVLQIMPQIVEPQADKIIQKNVPVVVNLIGDVGEDKQTGEVISKPPVVSVSGPSKLLAEIKQVGVTLDAAGAVSTFERKVAVKTGVKGVTTSPSEVLVTVPVIELPSKNLPVRLRYTGEPAAGFALDYTSVNPTSVQVLGSQDVLQGLTEISTMTVNISGIVENLEKEAVLILPDGAKSARPYHVQVKIGVVPVNTDELPTETDQPQVEEEDSDDLSMNDLLGLYW